MVPSSVYVLTMTCSDLQLSFHHLETRHNMTMMMMVADPPYSLSVPVNSCYAVQCGTCGKTTWKVSTLRLASSV